MGVVAAAVHKVIARPGGDLPEYLLDMEKSDEVEAVRPRRPVPVPALEPREEEEEVPRLDAPQSVGPGGGGAIVPVGERIELGVVVRRPVPQAFWDVSKKVRCPGW